jgi:hypothetical protein
MTIADILTARASFIVLQVLDLVNHADRIYHFGAFEVNPLVAHLTRLRSHWRVVLSKLIAVLIIFSGTKLMWVANLFYVGVVCWNVFVHSRLFSPHASLKF